MTKDNFLILKNSGILYARLIITSILGLLASRFVIQGLGVSDFGLYSVVGGIVAMLAFLNTVMISTTYRFITFEMGKKSAVGVNKIFNISLVIHLSLAILVLILAETAGVFYVEHYLQVEPGKTADALFVMRFSALATFFSVASIPYQGLVTANENFVVRASIEIVRSLLAFCAAIIIFYSEEKLRLFAILIAIANGTPALLFWIYCNKKYKEITRWTFQKDRFKYKEMLTFSGWIMIGAAAAVGKMQGSALIINAFFGTTLNAAFGIARQLNSVVLMFSKNLGQAAIPQITKSFSSGNTKRSIDLASHISKYTCFLMLIPSLPILLETDFLLNIWLRDVPPYAVIFCQLMIFDALIGSLGAGIPAVIQATGKIKYFQIILSSTSLMSLPFAYFLFKAGYPPYSIQIAFISTALINVVVRQVLLKRIIDFDVKHFIKISYLRILYVVLLIAPLFFIKNIFHYGTIRFFCFSFFSTCVLFIAISFVGLEKQEKIFAIGIIKKIFLRFKIRG
ncbi:MATE family efflux transporter [Desulfocicer niacini]